MLMRFHLGVAVLVHAVIATPICKRDTSALQYLYGDASADVQINEWMRPLPDDRRLNQISLPGSHDSMTAYMCCLPIVDQISQTQEHWVGKQLDMGIRALDLRFGFDKHEQLIIYHGIIPITPRIGCRLPQSIKVKELFAGLEAWLDLHPSEGLLVHVRLDHEGTEDAHNKALHVLADILAKTPSKYLLTDWRQGPPSLGEVRGKMTFMSSFSQIIETLPILGLSARWSDNKAYTTLQVGATTVHVEDNYELDTGYQYNKFDRAGAEKAQLAINNLYRSIERPQNTNDMWVTFLSAVQARVSFFPWLVVITPLRFAKHVNPIVSEWMRTLDPRPAAPYGLVFMDNPSQELITQIYQNN